MKKFILSLTVLGCVVAAQADDGTKLNNQPSTKAKTAAKMTCTAGAKEKSCCSSCCDKGPQKQALLTPKAAAAL
jgi:hypothetical protein